jgi:hypothetical protein
MRTWTQVCTEWWHLHRAQAGEELDHTGVITYGEILDSPLDALLESIFTEIPLSMQDAPEKPVEIPNEVAQHILALQESLEWHRLLVRLPLSISLPLISLAPPNNWGVTHRLAQDEQEALKWLRSNHASLGMYFRKPPTVAFPLSFGMG